MFQFFKNNGCRFVWMLKIFIRCFARVSEVFCVGNDVAGCRSYGAKKSMDFVRRNKDLSKLLGN